MANENELEKKAIEELLKETDRARVRAETMGPAGWLKCPLQSTNKRFLLNTLRSTGLHDRSSKSRERHSSRNSDLRSKSYDRSPGRSRSPHREDRRHEGHRESKKYQRDSHRNKDKKEDKERSHKHRDNKDKRHGKDRHSRRGPRE
ncbi:protein POLR1D [Cynoglossus semilaevis]|uniref:Si:ch211-140b10.6 n=1 Tax=Cynoglossus semilaevis TaxID=244447 RepID=A0A3P8WH64_CYNSE|nr:protein POLR1D [Cynoglossus semilaevis]